jgi:uncharacterized protein (DUF362 family)
MKSRLSRRKFIGSIGAAGAAVCAGSLTACGGGPTKEFAAKRLKEHGLSSDLMIVRGEDPGAMAKAAIEALGGIDKLVTKGDVVVVKPNMAWDRTPELAATTNPAVVAAVVSLCLEAGASKVKVFDRTCNDARRSYDSSGIAKAAEDAGASVTHVRDRKFLPLAIPDGKSMTQWPIYEDAARADILINIPIAKHHGTSRLTLGLKNMMGLAGGNRGNWHTDIHQRIADFATVTAVDLTIVDAYRVLIARGPTGGSLEDVRMEGLLVAGIDPVAVDAYCTTIFDLEPDGVGFVKAASAHGLGEMDLAKIKQQEIDLG